MFAGINIHDYIIGHAMLIFFKAHKLYFMVLFFDDLRAAAKFIKLIPQKH